MNKGFLDDTFEKALEAGQSMAKSGAKQIKQTFNPLQMIKGATAKENGPENGPHGNTAEKADGKSQNNTPLDFNKLQDSYGSQDSEKAKALASRLFQLVKSGDENLAMEQKRKDAEKKRQTAHAEEEKQAKEKQKAQARSAEMPQGKERKSIMGGKKKKSAAEPAPAELKPAQGKQ